MAVTVKKDGTKLTVSPEGKLGTSAAPELENAVKDNIEGVTELVFDFARLDYTASAGLRILLSSAKMMKKKGTMKVIHVNPAVMEVLEYTGLRDTLDIEAI